MASDYKEYSLGKLEEWLHDCLGAAEASPQEIYNKIKEVVQEEYYYYKNGASRTNELLQLLNGTVQFHIDPKGNNVQCSTGDNSEYCKNSWNDFWEENYYPEEVKDDGMRPWGHSDMEYLIANSNDKVKKWQLPVEVDTASDEYFVCFPDDLLEAANLKEGDKVEWVDNGDGSYLLKKAN
jgi:hypothetical protein